MKNALFLTGAAARISQEVAIIDQLIERKGLTIDPKTTMLAGYSSGALNIAAINACFREKSPLEWNDYYKEEILFKINTKEVYQKRKFFPLNTQGLRQTVNKVLADTNMHILNDFSFDTFILSFSYLRLTTLWASNTYNRHKEVELADLMMATTSIPIIFPDQNIRTRDKRKSRYIRGRFADGGIGGSFKRYELYLKKYIRQNGQLDNIYIISPMREVTQSDYDELNKILPSIDLFKLELKDFRLLKLFLEMISQNGFDTFIKRFYKWFQNRDVARQIYICIPKMENNYPILNFDNQRQQYRDVCQWADKNPEKLAIPISEYVKRFEKLPLTKIKDKQTRKLKHYLLSFMVRK